MAISRVFHEKREIEDDLVIKSEQNIWKKAYNKSDIWKTFSFSPCNTTKIMHLHKLKCKILHGDMGHDSWVSPTPMDYIRKEVWKTTMVLMNQFYSWIAININMGKQVYNNVSTVWDQQSYISVLFAHTKLNTNKIWLAFMSSSKLIDLSLIFVEYCYLTHGELGSFIIKQARWHVFTTTESSQ